MLTRQQFLLGREGARPGNSGCLLQIGAALERLGARMPSFHPLELLDASIQGAPVGAAKEPFDA